MHVTSFFVNGKWMMNTTFHHGKNKFASAKGKVPVYDDVDTLVLYTLSPGVKSEFMDVKLCKP